MTPLIVIVEDDIAIQSYLRKLLLDAGYAVRAFGTGAGALESIEEQLPDLVLLDLQLPDIQGESLCRDIRKLSNDLPIIILTAKDQIADKLQSFNLGADDYITKPFIADELFARIKAKLRLKNTDDQIIKVGDLLINQHEVTVTKNGKLIPLTPQEFKLLVFLAQNKPNVLSRDVILSRVWSYADEVESRVVDVYIGYLRKKIDVPFGTKYIRSVRGFGYSIQDE